MKILGASIVVTVLVMTPMAKDMRPSTNSDDHVNESTQVKEKEDSQEKDLTDVDLDKVVGKSAKDIKKLGFKKNKEDSKYYNGDICIGLDDTDTVKNLLQDSYDQENQTDDSYTVIAYDAKEKIVFAEEEDKVASICYSTLSDEEVADLKAKAEGNYIFPDSDKKYLSEDEVRSKSADELLKGRNEIYARHGRMFDMQELADYFAQQPWYEGTIPANQFDESVLNDYEKKNVQLIKQIEDEVNGASSSSGNSFNTGACSDLMASWANGVIPDQGSYVYITGRVTGHSGGTIFLQPHQVVPDMFVYYDSSQYTPVDGTEITVYGIMGVEVVDGQYSMDGYVFTN